MGSERDGGDWPEWEDDDECVGSCERCQGDVFRDEAHEIGGNIYCDQCAFWILEATRDAC